MLDAFVGDPTERDELEDDRRYLAYALRAAADHGEYMVDPVDGKTAVVRVSDLQSWAAELEAANA